MSLLGCRSGADLVAEVWRAGWTPEPSITVAQWAEQNRRMSERAGASGGRWSNAMTPYLVEPMECFTDPTVETITMMTATQVGKTSVLENCIMYAIDRAPGPALFVMHSIDFVRKHLRDRLMPSMKATPAVARHFTGNRDDERATEINFDRMNLYATGGNSVGNLSSTSAKYVFLDEIDAWADPRAIKEARARTKTFPGRKIVEICKPTLENTGIHERYKLGDQRKWWVPCPSPDCHQYQVLVFGQVKWDGGSDADPDVVEREAWYKCSFCGHRIENGAKGWMNARGVWAKDGQRVVVDGLDSDGNPRPRKIGEGRESRHASFHISGLMSPWQTFGQVARPFVESRGVPTQAWVNDDLGEPWAERGARTEPGQVMDLAKNAPSYKRGQVPHGVIVLTGAIDVQQGHVYYVVRGWGWRAEATASGTGSAWTALIDYGRVECPETPPPPEDGESPEQARHRMRMMADAWTLVDELVRRKYTRLDPDGRPYEATDTDGLEELETRWVIDSGYRTGEVYTFCDMRYPLIVPSKGERRIAGGLPHAETLIERQPSSLLPEERALRRATAMRRPGDHAAGDAAGAMFLLRVATDYWMDHVNSHMKRPMPLPGARVWPDDLTEDYARQVTSMQKRVKAMAWGTDHVWELLPGRSDNHLWDCEVYLAAHFDRYIKALMPELVSRKMAIARGERPDEGPGKGKPTRVRL